MWTKFPTMQFRTRISRNSQSNSLLHYKQPSMLGNYGTFLNAPFSLTSQWCLTWEMSKPKIFLKLKFVFLTTILGHSCLYISSSCRAYFIYSRRQSLQNRQKILDNKKLMHTANVLLLIIHLQYLDTHGMLMSLVCSDWMIGSWIYYLGCDWLAVACYLTHDWSVACDHANLGWV